jgi:hypothetical protein
MARRYLGRPVSCQPTRTCVRLTRRPARVIAPRELGSLHEHHARRRTVRAIGQQGGGMRELVERLRPARHLAAVSEPEDAA